MSRDPILEEVRQVRHEIEREYPSADAYYKHLQEVETLASSPELWRMIEERRHQGSDISLAEARARLEARERAGPRQAERDG